MEKQVKKLKSITKYNYNNVISIKIFQMVQIWLKWFKFTTNWSKKLIFFFYHLLLKHFQGIQTDTIKTYCNTNIHSMQRYSFNKLFFPFVIAKELHSFKNASKANFTLCHSRLKGERGQKIIGHFTQPRNTTFRSSCHEIWSMHTLCKFANKNILKL